MRNPFTPPSPLSDPGTTHSRKKEQAELKALAAKAGAKGPMGGTGIKKCVTANRNI